MKNKKKLSFVFMRDFFFLLFLSGYITHSFNHQIRELKIRKVEIALAYHLQEDFSQIWLQAREEIRNFKESC
jgi:hypothetical protein